MSGGWVILSTSIALHFAQAYFSSTDRFQVQICRQLMWRCRHISALFFFEFSTTPLRLKCCISHYCDKSRRFISFHMLQSGPGETLATNNPAQTVAWFHSWTTELKMRQDVQKEELDFRVFPLSHMSNDFKFRKPPPTVCIANPGYSFFNFMNQDQTLCHSFKVVKLEKKGKDWAAAQLEFKA